MLAAANIILRIYLMLFVVRSRLNCECSGAIIACENDIQIGARTKMNADDEYRIVQAIKMKLMMLNTSENGTTFELKQVLSLTVRLTVGLMYESNANVQLNKTIRYCSIKLWAMPFLNANKFQMKCDDDKQHEYHSIEGGIRQMNANEVLEFGAMMENVLRCPDFFGSDMNLKRIVSAHRVTVNGFIDVANVELRNSMSNDTMECTVEAWELSFMFRELNIACDSSVYKVISSRQTPQNQTAQH